jgi:TonB family protein
LLTLAKYILLLTLFAGCVTFCPAQTVQPQWEGYSSKDEEFSAPFPEDPTLSIVSRPVKTDEKPKHGRMYSAYSDGTVFAIISLDNPDRKEALETFVDEFQQYPTFHAGFSFEREIARKSLKGIQYRVASNTINGIVQFFMTNRHVYIFEVVGEDLTKPSVKQFLTSLTLDGKSKGKEIGEISRGSEVNSTPPPSAATPANAMTQSATADHVYNPKEVTRKAVVVTRAEPQYSEEARKNQVSGTIVIRAVFSALGKVTNVRTVSGLPYGLTERAVMAAKQIKFLPAVKDGKFVSQYIQIEYNFNLY